MFLLILFVQCCMAQITHDYIIPNQYIIYATSNTTLDTIKKHAFKLRYRISSTFKIGSFKGISIHTRNLLSRLSPRSTEIIDSNISPNQKFSISAVQFNASWNLARISSRDNPIGRSRYCYNETSTGNGVDVYVLDSGIYKFHPEFASRILESVSFVPESNQDYLGHGTHVAGIIGGIQHGVAKNVNLISVKVVDKNRQSTSETLIQGIAWSVDRAKSQGNPSIINVSVSGPFDDAVNAAAAAAVQQGVYVVSSAGNDYQTDACKTSPAGESTVFSVGAVDSNDVIADFTNIGPCVDMFAPGVNINSSWNDRGLRLQNGTSTAAPHVSGVLATLLRQHSYPSVHKGLNALKQMATHETQQDKSTIPLLFNGYPCP